MTKQYPAAYKYVQAKGYTKGRPDGRPLWIVQHTMQAHELSNTAEKTANYFKTMPDGRSVSAHLCIDDNTAIQCVDVRDSAWTVGNQPGNRRGLNYENAGYADQSAAQWTDEYSLKMLRLNAKCAVSDVKRFAIPVRRCTIKQLKAFQPGFTTHNDLRLAFGKTTHTDPGSNFPWGRYLAMVRDEIGAAVRTLTYQSFENTKMPILKYGDVDPIEGEGKTAWVTRAQLILSWLAPGTIDADGDYGDQTADAVKAVMGGEGTGRTIDFEVWRRLYALWGARLV